ncbi:HAD-IIB family hydrolase [Spiroplasma endosymbiont of Aspidapion aeneum]|uniref:HAD-IIB family hydrolase n=1 Tax=Spiroplasma endosymbiont of Aspidapion aeneum TaxID=3066276 RepID=UPI00313E726D
MSYKYIACDLDGTSLQTTVGKLTKKTIESVLAYQKESNNKFFIATGRNFIVTKHLADQLGVKLPIITLNGAVIYDCQSQKVLYQDAIANQIAVDITKFCVEKDYHIVANTFDKVIGIETGERIDFYLNELNDYPEIQKNNIVVYKKQSDMLKDIIAKKIDVVKFTISLAENDIQSIKDVEEMISKYDVANAGTYMMGRYLIDVFSSKANKGVAIKYMAKNYLNTDPKEIITLGDNNNDLEFIRNSNFGITLKNGVDVLKKIAFKVLEKSVEEDAVAYFLDELVKNKGEIK